MFRDLVVPHFRPVPFRILDRSSVPFRSAPFREIVTTDLVTFQPAAARSHTLASFPGLLHCPVFDRRREAWERG